jgi:hypothetical protein
MEMKNKMDKFHGMELKIPGRVIHYMKICQGII